jgi:hypothetical protein
MFSSSTTVVEYTPTVATVPTRLLSLLVLAASALFAQPDRWLLLRGINPGQDTHVHTVDGRRHNGGFISTSETQIVIRQRDGDHTFAKDQIRKVSVRKGIKRARNAAIGAVIGSASMGTLAAIAGDGDKSFVAAAAVGYAIIGAGIGAIFPGYDTLYRAPKP